jgi:transposase InsO family protein
MNENEKQAVALFRLAVLGDLIHAELGLGDQKRLLAERAATSWNAPHRAARQYSARTIEGWLYAYRKRGFDGLLPTERRDKGTTRAISDELQALILDMKREDPGRSVPLIIRELKNAGRVGSGDLKASAIRRLLQREGLSGPRMKVAPVARHRFVAGACNGLWQGDACHGPKLFDPRQGRDVRVKIFGLLDDKSRLVTHLLATFTERQEDFLRLLFESIRRRGVPHVILLDNHGSFTGHDVRVTCARLGIRLTFARPGDGASKGKIERFWRTLRAHVLDRLRPGAVETLDDLNLRLSTWLQSDYNCRPHGGIDGRSPLSVFEEEADEVTFIDDHAELEAHFVAHIERAVRADATCSVDGVLYEVPQHFRGRKVTLHYAVLHPGEFWIEEGGIRVPVRRVDAEANFHRRRALLPGTAPDDATPPSTGLNSVEDLLREQHRPAVKPPQPSNAGGDAADDAENDAAENDDDLNANGSPA